jgi:hypothetical protein
VNIPVAFSMWLFGPSIASASAWAFVCSLIEVALVYVAGHLLWGRRAAVLAALVIALLPLHVHQAGRLTADPPLATFITLSFLLFWVGEQRKHRVWYLAAGLACGATFWIKQVTILYAGAFAIYALVARRWDWLWVWVAVGASVGVSATFILMWLVAGDPLYTFKVMSTGMETFAAAKFETDAWYYFRYLFGKIFHTWLLGFLAVGGILIWIKSRQRSESTRYVVVWAMALVAIFSFMVASVQPLKLIPKQVNYMTMFIAPLSLLAGFFLATLSKRVLAVMLGVYCTIALALAALEQQVIRVFVANSKATVAFARERTGTPTFAMTNAYRASIFDQLVGGHAMPTEGIRPLAELQHVTAAQLGAVMPRAQPVAYAVVDTQTAGWARSEYIGDVKDVPACWRLFSELRASPGGLGRYFVAAGLASIRVLPPALTQKLAPKLNSLQQPKPAFVYEVSAECIGLK